MKLSKFIRKEILLIAYKSGINSEGFEGLLDEYFNFKKMKSNDDRFKDMYGDYRKHRILNYDWEDYWFFDDDRLNILKMEEKAFLELIEVILNNLVSKIDQKQLKYTVTEIDSVLKGLGFKISDSEGASKESVYKIEKIKFLEEEIKFFYDGSIHTDREDHPSFSSRIDQYPCFVFKRNNWNDYGIEGSFILYYLQSNIKFEKIGWMKIIQETKSKTILPKQFNELDESYCSIFDQEIAYRRLRSISEGLYNSVLKKINDCYYNKEIYEKFKKTSAFRRSILRSGESVQRLQEKYGEYDTDSSFQINLENSNTNFDFSEKDNFPYRINALIGKNGVGKTTLLKEIAESMLDHNKKFNQLKLKSRFTKIISICYSAFDSFESNYEDVRYGYVYCGLRTLKGAIKDPKILKEEFQKNIDKISQRNLDNERLDQIQYLLNDYSINKENLIKNFDSLSSGQRVYIVFYSELLANIENNSLILFDEPETHLHPSFIFRLIQSLYKILDLYESFAIIATHSSEVIQQIPARNVTVLTLSEGVYSSFKLPIESFGENYSSIIREVFGDYDWANIFYKKYFEDLKDNGVSFEKIEDAFSNRLSLNARIYLKGLFRKEG